MPRQIDLARLRYYFSLGFIAIGLALIAYVGVRQIGFLRDGEGGPLPVSELVKAGPDECPEAWRFIDNTEQRYTVCVPLNLVALDGSSILLLEEATDDDWRRLFADFLLVNDAGINLSSSDTDQAPLSALRLRIDVVPPGAAFDGCDVRSQPADGDGIATCSDTFFYGEQGQAVFEPEAQLHRFKALVPTQKDRSVNEVFSLSLTIVSLTEDWELQEPLFRELLPTLRPY